MILGSSLRPPGVLGTEPLVRLGASAGFAGLVIDDAYPLSQVSRIAAEGAAAGVPLAAAVAPLPERSLGPDSFRVVKISNVGGYAINPYWGDGHSTGLYSYEYLKRLAEG